MSGEIRPIFGLELEVSFSALDEQQRRLSSQRILQQLMSVAGSRFAHLPARDSSGIFLGNGSRLYLDCGKPEITTPEVTTPTDACRYTRAGEEILLEISRELINQMAPVKQIILTRGNVSYGGSGNAWACHESYGHRCHSDLAGDFIPHAVSRILYTGAGGFDSRSQGTRFLISPRAAHLHAAISENTQRNRGIYNTKNEPLNRGGYNRLHVICGEHVSSIRSQWLKMATTAVVVAMTQAGMSPGDGLRLRDPVKAMRAFARDVSLTATAVTHGGTHLTALDIQRQLLQKAKGLVVTGPLNDWLSLCCELWEETLDRLQQGSAAVGRSIDWAIKLELFRNYVQKKGLTWERLEQWNDVLEKLDIMRVVEADFHGSIGHTWTNRDRAASLRKMRRDLDPHSVLDWDELDLVLQVRHELFEIDTRFGEFGERGIFNSLDAQGLLDHHVAGVEDIRKAMTEPPAEGRAHLRGQAIRSIAERRKPGACEWNTVWDYADFRMLDLSDPFASQENWTSLAADTPGSDGGRHLSVSRAFDQAVSLYDRGEYESASRMLRIVVEWSGAMGVDTPHDCCRFSAWIQAHRGYADGASWLDAAYQSGPQSLSDICDYLLVYRFQGLRPAAGLRQWCQRGFDVLSQTRDADPRDIVALRCCHAYELLHQGRPEDAWNAYHDGVQPEWMQLVHSRFLARIFTEQADVLRRLGRFDEADSLLNDAQRIQTDRHYNGDLADFTLLQRAKIAVQNERFAGAWEPLERALQMQRDAANVVGEVRTLMLMSRIAACRENGPDGPSVDQMRERATQICATRPALTACPLASTINEHWDTWVAGETLDNRSDTFWGL